MLTNEDSLGNPIATRTADPKPNLLQSLGDFELLNFFLVSG